jgi:hypothetical protein
MSRRLAITLFGILALLGLPLGAAAAAGTPAEKCSGAKAKAASKKFAAKGKCYAKALASGGAVDSECLMKAETKFTAAFQKAEANGGCLTSGDAGMIEMKLDTCLREMVADVCACRPGESCQPGSGCQSDCPCWGYADIDRDPALPNPDECNVQPGTQITLRHEPAASPPCDNRGYIFEIDGPNNPTVPNACVMHDNEQEDGFGGCTLVVTDQVNNLTSAQVSACEAILQNSVLFTQCP